MIMKKILLTSTGFDNKKFEELFFWGKIIGEENDYFIAFGINYRNNYGFPKKIFYYAPSNTFKFEELVTFIFI